MPVVNEEQANLFEVVPDKVFSGSGSSRAHSGNVVEEITCGLLGTGSQAVVLMPAPPDGKSTGWNSAPRFTDTTKRKTKMKEVKNTVRLRLLELELELGALQTQIKQLNERQEDCVLKAKAVKARISELDSWLGGNEDEQEAFERELERLCRHVAPMNQTRDD